MAKPHPSQGEIDWVPLGKITVYPVTEDELHNLEKGSPDSLFLTIGIACLTTGIGAFLSLLALDKASQKVFLIYLVVAIIGALCGLILLLLWCFYSEDNRGVIKKIRARKPPIGDQLPTSPLPPAQVNNEN
ncbi:MAG TPA: hypothetical protein VIK53_06910 [Verrucomicrobiae bacterium]